MTDSQPDTDSTDSEPDAEPHEGVAGADAEPARPADEADAEADDDGVDTNRLRDYVERGVLAALFLFALVAAFRFYFAASNTIDYWVAGPYQSAFQAAFNLVVLLVVAAAILRQLQRMR